MMIDLKVRPSYVYQQYRDQQWIKDYFNLLDEYKQKEYYNQVKSFIIARDILTARSEYLTFYTYNLLGLYKPLGSTAVSNYYDIGYIYDGAKEAKTKDELYPNNKKIKYDLISRNYLNYAKEANRLYGLYDDLDKQMNSYFEIQRVYGKLTDDEQKALDDIVVKWNEAQKAWNDYLDKLKNEKKIDEAFYWALTKNDEKSLSDMGATADGLQKIQKYREALININANDLGDNYISQTIYDKWGQPEENIRTKASPFNNVLDNNFIYDDSEVYDGTISQAKFLLYLSYIYNYDYEISNLHYIVTFIANWCEIKHEDIKINLSLEKMEIILPALETTTEFVRLTINYGDVLGFPKGPFIDMKIEKLGVTK